MIHWPYRCGKPDLDKIESNARSWKTSGYQVFPINVNEMLDVLDCYKFFQRELLQFVEENKYEHLDYTRPNAHRIAVDYEDLKKEIEKLQRME